MGHVIHGLSMAISGFGLGFFQGWSLALPMLLLCPIIVIGLNFLIKGMTQKYIRSATAYAKCSAFSDQAMNAIRIVVAFGREKTELALYSRYLGEYSDIAAKASVRAGFGFGALLFSIQIGYSYAFTIGAVWVDQ